MLPVGNPASWMVKHDKDACFASNSCGQIAKKCVALGSCGKDHFCSLKFPRDFQRCFASRVVGLW